MATDAYELLVTTLLSSDNNAVIETQSKQQQQKMKKMKNRGFIINETVFISKHKKKKVYRSKICFYIFKIELKKL